MKFLPKWIAWEATERCNLTCIHCRCSSHMEKDLFALDTRSSFALIDNVASYCKPVFVLSGGEPLMRPDLYEIVRYGNRKGFRMCIATNGALLDDTHCRQMVESGVKIVSISLDGSTAAVHDDFRRVPGAFESVLQAAERLNRHGIKFIVNSSFTKRNRHDIAETFQKAKELGAMAWYMFLIVPTGRGKEATAELIETEDYEDILHWHYEREKEEGDILMRPTCAPHYYRLVIQRNKDAERGERLKRRSLSFSTGGGKGCIAAQSICFVNARGDVNPCSYLPLSAGNLLESSFKEIWEESKLFRDMRDFESYGGRCGKCEYLNVCGGCRARAYAIAGDYMGEEPFCDHVPHRLRKAR